MQRSSQRTAAALITLGLAAAVVVVAIAARAPLSRSVPVNARAAQAPTTALFMVLAGMGVVMLGLLVALAWSGRRRKDDPPEHEPTPIDMPWISKLVLTLLPFVVGAAVIVAAVLGARSANSTPRFGGAGPGGTPHRAAPANRGSAGFVMPSWLPWTLLGIVAIAIAAGACVLWVRRGRTTSVASEDGATRAAVQSAIDALDGDRDPRRAVIAAYAAMQRTLGEHGVLRSPAEAPREYLRRALLASRATERETVTLTDLFEEARYSTHPIPEQVREVALSALRSLRGRLDAAAAK